MWKIWKLAIYLCLFLWGPLMAEHAYPPRIGEPHPDFILPKIDDRTPVSLSQFRGRKVLLINFASW